MWCRPGMHSIVDLFAGVPAIPGKTLVFLYRCGRCLFVKGKLKSAHLPQPDPERDMNISHIQSVSDACAIASNHFEALRIVVVGKNSCERDISSAIPVDQLAAPLRCALKAHIKRFLNEIDFAIKDSNLRPKTQASFAPPEFTY